MRPGGHFGTPGRTPFPAFRCAPNELRDALEGQRPRSKCYLPESCWAGKNAKVLPTPRSQVRPGRSQGATGYPVARPGGWSQGATGGLVAPRSHMVNQGNVGQLPICTQGELFLAHATPSLGLLSVTPGCSLKYGPQQRPLLVQIYNPVQKKYTLSPLQQPNG